MKEPLTPQHRPLASMGHHIQSEKILIWEWFNNVCSAKQLSSFKCTVIPLNGFGELLPRNIHYRLNVPCQLGISLEAEVV